MEYVLPFGLPVISHAEDAPLARGFTMNEGVVSTELGLPGAPAAAEDVMVARDILLAELTGAHVHIAHRSEEHTSELQSRLHLVCRLLLEKKKNNTSTSPVA